MKSGWIILTAGFIVFCLAVISVCGWLSWLIFWQWDTSWDAFGFDVSWIVKIFVWLLLCLTGMSTIYAAFVIIDSRGTKLAEKLSVLPEERKAQRTRQVRRVIQDGRLSEAIQLCREMRDHELAIEAVSRLPDKAIRQSLIDTGQELVAFERSLAIAQRAGVDETIISMADDRAQATASIFWGRAQRIALTYDHQLDSPRIKEGLRREADRMTRLTEAIREAREGLAELTLGGGKQVAEVEGSFQALAATAQEIQNEELS